MRRKNFALFVGVAGLALAQGLFTAGCATVSIATDYDHAANFSHYKTFSFAGGHIIVNGMADDANTILQDRIHSALVLALTAKGLVETNGTPDLLVGYVAGARRRTEIEGMGPYMPGVGPYWNTGWWTPGYMDWWTRTYEEGTLVIDLVDAPTKRLVWRAYARSEVNKPPTEEKIQSAVNKAFQKYPPQP